MPSGKPIKKLPIKTFLAIQEGPSPARIFITLKYDPKFEVLRFFKGFKFTPQANSRIIDFEIPVMPPTFKIDFGNSKDTKNVVQTGEVVLPKYGKAWQYRWDSFFPYNPDARYVKQSARGLSMDATQAAFKEFGDLSDNFMKKAPTPALYINIFNELSLNNTPFEVAIYFYNGGNIGSKKVTIDSFSAEPDNSGDYKYSISLVEWKDISPKTVDAKGNIIDSAINQGLDSALTRSISNFEAFFLVCKQCFSYVSKALMIAAMTYNQMQSLVFTAQLRLLQFKSSFKDLAYRLRTFDNMFGLAKITSKDTRMVNNTLKTLDFSRSNKQMADFLLANKKYSSGKI